MGQNTKSMAQTALSSIGLFGARGIGQHKCSSPKHTVARSRAPRRFCVRAVKDEPSAAPKISRRDIVSGIYFGVGTYLAYDLVQDLGLSVGDNAKPVPEYEGIQGVGSLYKVATFA